MKLFPPGQQSVSEEMDDARSTTVFESLWHRLERRFFKYERLQHYRESADSGFDEFSRGQREQAIALMEQRVAAQAALYEEVIHKGADIVRLRFLERPLTPYLQFEFESYRISARHGERILVIDSAKRDVPEARLAWDFLLFDEFAAMIHNYGADGELKSSFVIDQPRYVKPYVELADRLIASAIPFESLERAPRTLA